MLVVNQDKTVILNLDSLYCVMLDKDETNKIIYGVSRSKGDIMKMGEYKTEERARKVLQEIIETYLDGNKEERNCRAYGYGYVKNIVYKMPED